MRVELQLAYILHRRPYRNTSAILEAFTQHHGRVGLVARGIQRPQNPLLAVLQPFSRVLLSWTGRGELMTLIHAESANLDTSFMARPTASMFYLNELMMRLLQRDDPHEEMFVLYESTLQSLFGCELGRDDEIVLRIFEKRLLAELGYGLVLHNIADSGDAVVAGELYRYLPDIGPLPNTPTMTGGILLHGESLLALAAECICSDRALRESKQLMRFILREHLGDKPLQSRMLYNRQY
jgi:DNA repair protein RecO (recombination protein O)